MYSEFAREKEALFDRWCSSREVTGQFEKLRQLVLVEEFKACVPKKATILQQAAVLADDYSLTHRSAFLPTDIGLSNIAGGKDKSSTSLNLLRPGPGNHRSRSVVCNYCHCKGHVLADCWSLQKRKSDALVCAVEDSDLIGSTGSQRVPVNKPDKTYQPFISEGLVSLTEDGISVPVRVLRDT